MDVFIDLLDGNDTILMWISLDVIANLTSVDIKNKFDGIFQKYYAFLSHKSMVTAAHVIDNSAVIAKSKPHFRNEIIDKLLNLEQAPYSRECRNILIGKAIRTLDSLVYQIDDRSKIISFVTSQLGNSRNATRAKAEKFLRNHTEQAEIVFNRP
jgi:hypothetical protein